MGRPKKGARKKKGGVITKAPRTEEIEPEVLAEIEAAGAFLTPTDDPPELVATLPMAEAILPNELDEKKANPDPGAPTTEPNDAPKEQVAEATGSTEPTGST